VLDSPRVHVHVCDVCDVCVCVQAMLGLGSRLIRGFALGFDLPETCYFENRQPCY
jgi:hypothetical protein